MKSKIIIFSSGALIILLMVVGSDCAPGSIKNHGESCGLTGVESKFLLFLENGTIRIKYVLHTVIGT